MTAASIQLSDPRAVPAQTAWLRNVYPFYIHDLSHYAPDAYTLTAEGTWEPDYLDWWLSKPFCHPLVILRDEKPVGFAMVGEAPFPFLSEGVQFQLTEFFILRADRRAGLGAHAALAILARFRGSFELSVLERNAPALSFWRRTLPAAATGPIREESIPGEVRFSFTTATISASIP